MRASLAALAGALAVAALTALVVAPAPSYDPWSWLLWGRELAGGTLSTEEGPAFKPLPVAACALLAPLGDAAPEAWVVLARAGAVLAVWLAFALGRALAGGSVAAGLAAAAGVGLSAGFPAYAAAGAETGWTVALGLAAFAAWRAERLRAAILLGVACALLRVEAWPFLLAAGAVAWRRRPADRPLLAACAIGVPALWLGPEWLGSGDALRSGARARVPNPGQPALADVPALASLRAAAGLPPWPLWAGAVACLVLPGARGARALLGAGLAWIGLVALMAQGGFSGEARYALPGAGLAAVAGSAGLAALVRAAGGRARPVMARLAPARPRPLPARRDPVVRRRAAAAVVGAVLAAAVAPRAAAVPDLHRAQAWQHGLAADLPAAIAAAGGRDAVLACGRPYVGPFRGPLLAYHLRIEKRRVGFAPEPPGAVFRSRLHAGNPPEPAAGAAFARVAAAGRWEVRTAC